MTKIFLFALLLCSIETWAEGNLVHGEYIFKIAGCAHCHTSTRSEPLAGGKALVTPFGNFYPPNISPETETGIGRWTEENFFRALRFGISPDRTKYYPAFPYTSYTNMTDQDIFDLYAYLRVQPPVRRENRPHEIRFPFDQRWLNYFWQKIFFAEGPIAIDPARDVVWNRGAYLVRAVAHCAECHTPKNSFGAPILSQWMAGSADLLPGWPVPNVTPDLETGTGRWSEADWNIFLSSGFTPLKKTVGGEMAHALEGVAAMTDSDRRAMIVYLRALKPVRNYIGVAK